MKNSISFFSRPELYRGLINTNEAFMNNQPQIPLTHRSIWALAGPIIISNLSTPLVGAVDTAVVGHLPEPQAIGAVALGALIY